MGQFKSLIRNNCKSEGQFDLEDQGQYIIYYMKAKVTLLPSYIIIQHLIGVVSVTTTLVNTGLQRASSLVVDITASVFTLNRLK